MKTTALKIALIALLPAFMTSCMTTYDAHGNPVQSVDPGAATAVGLGAAAVGYAAGRNSKRDNYYYGSRYHGRRSYWRGGRRYWY